MILKLLVALTAAVVLLGSLYLEVHKRNQGILDTVKPQRVPAMRSANTIHNYSQ